MAHPAQLRPPQTTRIATVHNRTPQARLSEARSYSLYLPIASLPRAWVQLLEDQDPAAQRQVPVDRGRLDEDVVVPGLGGLGPDAGRGARQADQSLGLVTPVDLLRLPVDQGDLLVGFELLRLDQLVERGPGDVGTAGFLDERHDLDVLDAVGVLAGDRLLRDDVGQRGRRSQGHRDDHEVVRVDFLHAGSLHLGLRDVLGEQGLAAPDARSPAVEVGVGHLRHLGLRSGQALRGHVPDHDVVLREPEPDGLVLAQHVRDQARHSPVIGLCGQHRRQAQGGGPAAVLVAIGEDEGQEGVVAVQLGSGGQLLLGQDRRIDQCRHAAVIPAGHDILADEALDVLVVDDAGGLVTEDVDRDVGLLAGLLVQLRETLDLVRDNLLHLASQARHGTGVVDDECDMIEQLFDLCHLCTFPCTYDTFRALARIRTWVNPDAADWSPKAYVPHAALSPTEVAGVDYPPSSAGPVLYPLSYQNWCCV